MIRILGARTTACDGTTRRELLRAGGLSLFGSVTLPRLLRAAASPSPMAARARSIILVNLFGGPSHLDMFDLKPAAPVEIRQVDLDLPVNGTVCCVPEISGN